MTTLNTQFPTLLDQIKRMDPNGAVAKVVESLSFRTPMLQDAVFKEGNLPTGHRFTSRTALPSIGWRRFNEGVAASKSQTGQVDETCGLMEGNSVVDVALANLNGNSPAFRASEDSAFLQSFTKEAETGLFYHSTKTAPERFMGLSPRLDATAGNPAAAQIIKLDATAAGNDQASIHLVGWGDTAVYGIYPKGTTGGIKPKDMGEQLWDDGSGKKFIAYVMNWSWQMGLCVQDSRYLVRIANIDTGNLAANTDSIIQAMIDAYYQMQDVVSVRPIYYCNRLIARFLHKQALNNTKQSTLTIENIGGKPILMFLGIPVRTTDALVNTEAPVV